MGRERKSSLDGQEAPERKKVAREIKIGERIKRAPRTTRVPNGPGSSRTSRNRQTLDGPD